MSQFLGKLFSNFQKDTHSYHRTLKLHLWVYHKRQYITWFHLNEMSIRGKYIGKVNWCFPGTGEGGVLGVTDFWGMRWWNYSKIRYGDGCTVLWIQETTELFILNGWILWYISYISINLLKMKIKLEPPDYVVFHHFFFDSIHRA